MNILCLGGSYTGRHLARNFGGHTVHLLAREPDRVRLQGYRASSSLDPAGKTLPAAVDLVLDTVPPVTSSDDRLVLPYARDVRFALERNPNASYVHVSSTSVYPPGGRVGVEGLISEVDESTPAAPATERGEGRLRLEELVLRTYPRATIVRSGGIYGLGRCIADRFRAGDFRGTDRGNRVVSRIHVTDLCRLVLAVASAAVAGGKPPRYVNAVDLRPSPNKETFEYIERLLDITVPGNWREGGPVGRKVTSKHAAELLGGRYEYPSYREGFVDCLEVGSARS